MLIQSNYRNTPLGQKQPEHGGGICAVNYPCEQPQPGSLQGYSSGTWADPASTQGWLTALQPSFRILIGCFRPSGAFLQMGVGSQRGREAQFIFHYYLSYIKLAGQRQF